MSLKKNILPYIIFCLLTCLSTKQVTAIVSMTQLDNFIEHFSPQTYFGDLQVWAAEQGDDGKLFFASANGLSLYDGNNWMAPDFESYALRALYYDQPARRLYCGGDNEFGMWEQDECGQFRYTSLFKNQNPSRYKIIWRIANCGDLIYFQSNRELFRYNTKTRNVETVFPSTDEYNFMGVVNGCVYVQVLETLYRIDGDKKTPLPNRLTDRVAGMLANPITGEIYVFRENEGIFALDHDGKLHLLDNAANRELKGQKICVVKESPEGYCVIGTTLGGLFITDQQGEIISRTNNKNGLPDLSVQSLAFDRKGNYWLGLDAGIAKINRSPSEGYITNYKEDIGSVHTLLNANEKLYIGTNKGVFMHGNRDLFTLIDGTQGQTWNIQEIGKEVIVSHDFGLLSLNGNQGEIVSRGGVWSIIPIPGREHLYISANYSGFSLYSTESGRLQWVANITGFNSDTRLSAFDKYGYLWVMSTNTGFFRIKLSDDYTRVQEGKLFTLDKPRGLMLLFEIDQELIFYANSKTYRYDVLQEQLVADEYAQSIVDRCGKSLAFFQQFGNLFWYNNYEGVGLIVRNHNQFTNYPSLFQGMDKFRIPYVFQRICQIGPNTFAYGLRNRIGIYEYRPNTPKYILSAPKLASIEITDKEVSRFVPLNEERIRLSTHYDNIKIALRELHDSRIVSYRILGLNDNWEEVKVDQYLPLPRLAPGRYTLELRNHGQEDSEVLTLEISVAPTLLLSAWAMLAYLAIILLLISLLDHYHRKRSKIKIENALQQEQLKQQQEREAMEREVLTNNLKERDKKLASYMMSELNKNNLLIDLKEDLVQLSKGASAAQADLLVRKIDRQLNSQEDWRVFLKYFNNIYDGFFDRLHQQYPNLSIADQKLCAYLKLQLNTKEIAVLLNISPSSVDTARHRLRKKLEIDPQTTLSAFFADI